MRCGMNGLIEGLKMDAIFYTKGIYKTASRLAYYKQQAEKYPGKPWQYWTRNIWETPSNARGDKGQIFSDTVDQYGENIGDAHQVANMRSIGWFTDSYQEETIRGAVCRMRCPRGTLYIPVTYCTGWDGTTHYLADAILVPKGAAEEEHEAAKKDAARLADGFAESEAEESREFYAKDRADEDIAQARADIHAVNKKALALVKEIKGAEFTPAICLALRETLARYMEERKGLFRLIEKRRANYWSAVEC